MVLAMFRTVGAQDGKSRCKNPCTKSRYTTRSDFDTPFPYTVLHIVFDQKISVLRSRLSIYEINFLTQSGGFIGCGRTLLWILVSLLGVTQVVLKIFSMFPYGVSNKFSIPPDGAQDQGLYGALVELLSEKKEGNEVVNSSPLLNRCLCGRSL